MTHAHVKSMIYLCMRSQNASILSVMFTTEFSKKQEYSFSFTQLGKVVSDAKCAGCVCYMNSYILLYIIINDICIYYIYLHFGMKPFCAKKKEFLCTQRSLSHFSLQWHAMLVYEIVFYIKPKIQFLPWKMDGLIV